MKIGIIRIQVVEPHNSKFLGIYRVYKRRFDRLLWTVTLPRCLWWLSKVSFLAVGVSKEYMKKVDQLKKGG